MEYVEESEIVCKKKLEFQESSDEEFQIDFKEYQSDYLKDKNSFLGDMTHAEIKAFLDNWKGIKDKSKVRDKCYDSYYGGIQCQDMAYFKKIRSAGWEILKMLGKKLISGDFNLTRISFPIKMQVAQSALERVVISSHYFPIFMGLACRTNDPIERMKYVVCIQIACAYMHDKGKCFFSKPLNPILGETFEACLADGTEVTCE